jgi:hypothetical protein
MAGSPARDAAVGLAAVTGRVKQGSLRMHGAWFGRAYDNVHVVCSARAGGRDLVIGFRGGEELTVADPADWEFNAATFRISGAARVTWRWYDYGRPHRPSSRFTIEHWTDENGVLRARSDASWYAPGSSLSTAAPAAELLRTDNGHERVELAQLALWAIMQ